MKNLFAIIEFDAKESVEKVLSEPNEHCINNKSVKVKRREIKEFLAKKTNNNNKEEMLSKLKEEALTVNSILIKCRSVSIN